MPINIFPLVVFDFSAFGFSIASIIQYIRYLICVYDIFSRLGFLLRHCHDISLVLRYNSYKREHKLHVHVYRKSYLIGNCKHMRDHKISLDAPCQVM